MNNSNFVYILWQKIYFVVIGLVVLYVLFWLTNNVGLKRQTGEAIVDGKDHKAAGTSYQNTYIQQGTRQQVITRPISTPEMFILNLKLNGKRVAYPVTKEKFESTTIGSQIKVQFVTKRLTGSYQIIQ
jgi:hypothetical protein